ncbi:phytanoyl-CoA dioxygenase family protein [Nocardiopsis sp. CNT-189]|uniref:phytanoyl-CoA dioxygenase family protein n=1 Tax=Nocardiopsis oceanisediminis TaxID=2816862 RepID=UPI003B2B4DEF
MSNPHEHLPAIRALVLSPEVTAPARALLGPRIAVENTFLITKPPRADMEVPPHQDGTNDRLLLDPQRAATVWLALTDATPASGCLRIAPGSQTGGYLPTRRAEAPGRPLTIDAPAPSRWESVPVKAGHGLLMDARLIHTSPPNRTDTPRVGLNIRYAAPGGCRMRDGSAPGHLTPVPAADR